VTVSVVGTRRIGRTDASGRYDLVEVPSGTRTLIFRMLGIQDREVVVDVPAGGVAEADVVLAWAPLPLDEIRVTAASRQAERVVEAPVAVSVPDPAQVRALASTGQVALVVADLPGVRAPQSGVTDFALNARGFNSALSRRVLVLIDGRDPSVPISGNQEWAGLSLESGAQTVEFVRGPGSALYGANAFNGVLSITSPAVRRDLGTRLSVSGGDPTDLRFYGQHAWLSDDLRWGFKLSGGVASTRTTDVSRTNVGDLRREYAAAIDTTVFDVIHGSGYEVRPLAGQTKEGPFGLPGAVTGEPDPVRSSHVSGRVDYYQEGGGSITGEAGVSYVENTVATTTSGRSQIVYAALPWARLAWNTDHSSLMAYYTGRNDEVWGLDTNSFVVGRTGTLHAEGQLNRSFDDDRGRVVAGASVRSVRLDSRGTLFVPEGDGRADESYALFGQGEYEFTPWAKAVVAARLDAGEYFDRQFSPRGGLVLTPRSGHALRATLGRAFLTPSALQRFISFPAGLPLDLGDLEAGLRVSPLGPLLAGVEPGTLFGNSAAVPLLLLGNEDLEPQETTSFEVGYKGQFDSGLSLGVDAYYSSIDKFSASPMPGGNPAYGDWTAPETVPEVGRGPLEDAVIGTLGPGLTRLSDGSTAFVLSGGNAGSATDWGFDFAVGVQLSDEWRVDANYSFYDFELDDDAFLPGDSVVPNTPRHQGNASATYQRADGLRARLGVRLVDQFLWETGIVSGTVPSSQTVDLNVGVPMGDAWRATLVATNLLDQERYYLMGGSVVGRRILLGLVWSP
jgi:outer membrane receptor protein involved in Fe transport